MQYLIVTKTFKDAYAVLCTCIAPGEKCTSFHYICFVHLYCIWREVYKFATTSVLCTCTWREVYKFATMSVVLLLFPLVTTEFEEKWIYLFCWECLVRAVSFSCCSLDHLFVFSLVRCFWLANTVTVNCNDQRMLAMEASSPCKRKGKNDHNQNSVCY